MEIFFASHNEHKVAEVHERLKAWHVVRSLRSIGWEPEIPEDGLTLRENSLIKVRALFQAIKKPCIADDTGLEVDALEGAPGVYSARYAGPAKDSEANMDLLLKRMKWMDDRRARSKSCLSLIISGEAYVFEGIVKGHICHERRGEGGFGYDPIFIPEGHDRSFAEMSMQEKNQFSHRARTLDKLTSFLAKLA